MNSYGFSLLEILIVMIISAVLVSVGIASWRDMQDRHELSSVTLGILQFLNEAKIDANTYNYNQNIHFIKQNDQEWCMVAREDEVNAECVGFFQFINTNKQVELIGFSNNPLLIFYGRRNTAKAVTIRLKNRIGESRIIISVPGRIRYCSYRTYLAGFIQC